MTRDFDFEPGTDFSVGVRVIRAALDDEGLVVLARSTSKDEITTVLTGEIKRFRVPESRIGRKG